ncbi:MAG: FAD-dependent oxidoreductase [Eubacteriales bacterium]|nr:FAD-dependent oxidoreductase [Eubacteriales bacterium]
MKKADILIIGGGIAGIQAAKTACALGRSVLLIDRNPRLGGVLPQCTHRGFAGALTGPEYLAAQLADFPAEVQLRLSTAALSVGSDKTAVLSSRADGVWRAAFSRLILATGCREVAAGALGLGGTRPEGVYTAGQAQALLNLEGIVPPGPIVILGSGDLGLIMAAQLREAGAEVAAIVEKKPLCGGLIKNRRRLEPLHIPLYTGASLRRLAGSPRLVAVEVLTEDGRALTIPCRSLLIAAGLQPEQSLVRDLGEPDWLYLCGNCRQIHTMVESVAAQGAQAAMAASNEIGEEDYD